MAESANALAPATQNLPAQRKTPEFPVDRERLAKESGGSVEERYHAPLGMVKDLIRAVKVGYVKKVIDEGVQNPSPMDVFKANEADIIEALRAIMKTSKLFDQQSLPLPLVNNENNKLWAFVGEFTKNPAKYGLNGFSGIQKLKPIGRDSTLAAPKK